MINYIKSQIYIRLKNSATSLDGTSLDKAQIPPPRQGLAASGVPKQCPAGRQVHGAALQAVREAEDLRVDPGGQR